MSMLDQGLQGATRGPTGRPAVDEPSGAGWVLFAGMMLTLLSILNLIYGIGAIADSSFFVNDARYVIGDLNTYGWIMVGLGALQMGAAFSIWNGNSFGVWFGIAVASVNAIGALLSIPSYPFLSMAIFAVDILVIYGLAAYGGQHRPL
ncbi:MAG TPA: hypothetical protein VK501_22400 [Baekduia sp.]|uniref:DUF7144 family membrane protein n=1 Tax=Baekduia sp. TaxID=2600305 RepID=UPI002B76E041|nr:hypothetical protein [Baekduia sp.]HMJ36673.1 hypothetical protein [Baekduia sp.]